MASVEGDDVAWIGGTFIGLLEGRLCVRREGVGLVGTNDLVENRLQILVGSLGRVSGVVVRSTVGCLAFSDSTLVSP